MGGYAELSDPSNSKKNSPVVIDMGEESFFFSPLHISISDGDACMEKGKASMEAHGAPVTVVIVFSIGRVGGEKTSMEMAR